MKMLRQFLWILAFSAAGELLHVLLPLPVPASIYGLVLLFLALQSGRLPLEAVKDAGKFLLEIMPLLFLPAAVGLMESWEVLRPVLLPFAVITVVSTVLVMGCSGRMTQAVIRRFSRKEAPHR